MPCRPRSEKRVSNPNTSKKHNEKRLNFMAVTPYFPGHLEFCLVRKRFANCALGRRVFAVYGLNLARCPAYLAECALWAHTQKREQAWLFTATKTMSSKPQGMGSKNMIENGSQGK